MRFLFCVDNLVSAERAGLPEALSADLALKRTGTSMHRHVSGQIVMCVEYFAANFAGESFRNPVTSLSANRTRFGTHRWQGRRFAVFQSQKATSGNKDSRARIAVIAASW